MTADGGPWQGGRYVLNRKKEDLETDRDLLPPNNTRSQHTKNDPGLGVIRANGASRRVEPSGKASTSLLSGNLSLPLMFR